MQRSSYAAAGVQLAPGICMNVRSHVYMPDSEAGYENDRQQYFAQGKETVISRNAPTIPTSYAVLLLAVVLGIFACLVGGRLIHRAQLSRSVSENSLQIAQTELSISQLNVDVAKARDSARIAYMAVQDIGMVAASGVESIPVTAPNTRPGSVEKQYTSGMLGSSPLSNGLEMISGSR